MSVLLYAGSDRSSTSAPGRVTRHSFSFGEHYDPANLGFGPLVCHNDDALAPGAGYPDHPHSGLEIVTWVLEGALVHTDSTGARHVLEAGRAQVLSAGSGIRHSEVADPGSGRCRFIQAWLTPDSPGATPSYAVGGGAPDTGQLVDVAGGDGLPLGTAGPDSSSHDSCPARRWTCQTTRSSTSSRPPDRWPATEHHCAAETPYASRAGVGARSWRIVPPTVSASYWSGHLATEDRRFPQHSTRFCERGQRIGALHPNLGQWVSQMAGFPPARSLMTPCSKERARRMSGGSHAVIRR